MKNKTKRGIKFLQLIVLFLPGIYSYAQTISGITLTGVIKDSSTNEPLRFATVRLFKASQTYKPVKVTTTSEAGKFSVAVIEAGDYKIFLTHAGYAERQISVSVIAGQTKDLGVLFIEKQSAVLGEVVVKARRPLIEEKDDLIIFNVADDPSLEGKFASDALQVTPFVAMNADGSFSVNGKAVKFLLNGRVTGIISSNLKEILKILPANLIKRIEVITSPSARYDAEGYSSVINIISKKISGYTAGLGLYSNILGTKSFSTAPYLSLKFGKFGLTGYGSFINDKPNLKSQSDFISNNSGAAFSQRHLETNGTSGQGLQMGSMELSWDIDSLLTLSGYGRIEGSRSKSSDQTDLMLTDVSGNITDTYYFENKKKSKTPVVEFGLDIIKKFSSASNKEFTFSINREINNNTNNVESNQYYTSNPDRFIINNNDFKNIQTTIQSDFILPFKNSRSFETGVKAIFRNILSDYESLIRNPVSGDYEPDINNFDKFSYKQNVAGVYTVYRLKLKKALVNAGLRLEHTFLTGDFITTQTKVEQRYTNLFPSLNMSQRLKKGQSIRFSYNRKIARPSINYLNPFIDNYDSLFISYGQPGLKPEFSNSLEFTYSLNMQTINFSAGINYTLRNEEIIPVLFFDNLTGVTTTTYSNEGKSQNIGLNLFFRYRMKKIYVTVSGSVRHVDVVNKSIPEFSTNGFTGNCNFNIDYQATKNWWIRYASNLNFPRILPQGTTNLYYWYRFFTEYRIFKNKVMLFAETIRPFSQYLIKETNTTDKLNNFTQFKKDYIPYRTLKLGISYSFGKLKESVSRKKGVIVDDVKQ